MGDVEDYLTTLSGPERDAVARVYERARALVPGVEEGRSYGMPALRYRGSPLVSVMVTRTHLGVYPFSPDVITALADELQGFRTTKGSVSFQPDSPLPDDVLDRIVAARRDEIDARAR
ncbi:iron chaperone [Krasilnikoviella flava]|uniref:Uncharacterized conserved protein YdhG, YjbR/CyaY-like superfamily, DUF1801 family n=1 Tax=Krasilnikoviella flava TaxID=526729 RepID=A0A1T5L636_9MICO|nr:DUF1801 domain-containing protein [Krasilnikoviella flava]SKC71370.1 Uncharacterized conserved protein YdhG, YjbR/CyaY-like superfamily, DUF1801 family [Krasilnikoviella flava]